MFRMSLESFNYLTLSCLDISLTRLVWNIDTSENNIVSNQKFTKYLKESCGLILHQYFSFKYLLYISFVRNSQVILDATGMSGSSPISTYTGELGYDGLNGTRKIGPSYAKSVVYI